MKKVLLAAVVLVMVFSAGVFAEDGGTSTVTLDNCVSTNIYPWFVVWMNASYERMLGNIISVKVGASTIGNTFGLGASVLFHPMGKGLDGFFVGPKYDAWIMPNSGTLNWLGGIFGYNFLINNAAIFGLGVGVQFNVAGPIFSIGDFNFGDKWPTVETSIGWAF